MKTIVAATDLSDRSTKALERAAALAMRAGAELVIVHAVDDNLPKTLLGHRTSEAEGALRQAVDAITDVKARWEVAVGDIFWALHRAATKAHADLIVAGDHRRSPIRDVFRDTTVERLIRVSAVPVLIARTPASSSYRHALVGVESEEGRELLHTLSAFGRAAPAKATILHAISASAEGLMYYAGIERKARENYRTHVEQEARSRLSASLGETQMPVDIKIVEEAPSMAITEFAKEAGCDLVTVSSHARRAAARGILGSVSSELIRHGTTDLLIVPRIVAGS